MKPTERIRVRYTGEDFKIDLSVPIRPRTTTPDGPSRLPAGEPASETANDRVDSPPRVGDCQAELGMIS